MAYQKKDWVTGEIILESDLDHLETQYDEVKAELAKIGGDIPVNASNVTGTFTGNITLGGNNQHVLPQRSVTLKIDTRTVVLTYDANGRLTKVEEKDGATVVKTTNLIYDGNGFLSQVQESAGGTTVTTTLNYDANGNLTSVSKAVS